MIARFGGGGNGEGGREDGSNEGGQAHQLRRAREDQQQPGLGERGKMRDQSKAKQSKAKATQRKAKQRNAKGGGTLDESPGWQNGRAPASLLILLIGSSPGRRAARHSVNSKAFIFMVCVFSTSTKTVDTTNSLLPTVCQRLDSRLLTLFRIPLLLQGTTSPLHPPPYFCQKLYILTNYYYLTLQPQIFFLFTLRHHLPAAREHRQSMPHFPPLCSSPASSTLSNNDSHGAETVCGFSTCLPVIYLPDVHIHYVHPYFGPTYVCP